MTELTLAHGLAFEDLYEDQGLARIDALFLDHLGGVDADLKDRLVAARAAPDQFDRREEGRFLLELAPVVDSFLGELFGIGDDLERLAEENRELEVIYTCKRRFLRMRALKTYKGEAAAAFDGPALEAELTELFGGRFDQLTFARQVMTWLEDKDANADALDLAARYGAWAIQTEAGRARHKGEVLFHRPQMSIDYFDLVAHKTVEEGGVTYLQQPNDEFYYRDGFALTDPGTDLTGALDEANYCSICHDRERDFCARGLTDKATGKFVDNPLKVTLEGCPLEERISEMQKAKLDGLGIAPVALMVVDNPMVAGTGHRICNDCMKSCIYQKQAPVDIPQVETRVLKEMLALPWGFEIYGLLTRWNPLNLRRPLPLSPTNYKVLVVGIGPAGFTLAHYLLNEGHWVVAIDGLKIEPLPPEISGVTVSGERVPFQPIRDVSDLYEPLDERVQAGFGGVAEYGITVRWDKNFLKILRLLVERRQRFTMFGGVRFGSALTKESAFEMGFDHIALCLGAGKPTTLSIPNQLARGVRQASDFLMALQLTGAAKRDSVANLQLRLPAVIVGGGLTAIDAATEAMAYYVRQVEKFTDRYDVLVAEAGEAKVRERWTEEETLIADEFLAHGRAVRAEREKAAKEGREPRFIDLVNQWGGATIAYRRRMTGSPSYQLNHEEIIKAFEQGVRFAELLAPKAVEVDEYRHVKALRLERQTIGEDGRPQPTGEEVVLPARSVIIAAGTTPNTVLAREHPGFAALDGKYFQAVTEEGEPVTPPWTAKPETPYVLMNPREDGRWMSFFGDLHPSYAGNVVKAMASARQGYAIVDRAVRKIAPSDVAPEALVAQLNDGLRPVVHDVIRLADNVTEVVLRAPLAARAHGPGQFFRLQNYEAFARRVDGTTLAMEGVALTGARVDLEKGLVSVISLDMGGSTSILRRLQPGDPIVMMGPTGAATHTEGVKTVLLCGGGVGNAVLLSINRAFHEAGTRVLYFAAYKGVKDRFHIDAIEANSDVVVWCCDEPPGFEPGRPQDKAFVGNIVQAMLAYAEGKLGPVDIRLDEADRLIAIGSDIMMGAVAEARRTSLAKYLKPDIDAVASINSPMQCMMKEICAQCLQTHIDPQSGEESVVFSCFNQDQPMDRIDFGGLHQRLCQNAVQEKLTAQWIQRCLADVALPPVVAAD